MYLTVFVNVNSLSIHLSNHVYPVFTVFSLRVILERLRRSARLWRHPEGQMGMWTIHMAKLTFC